MSDDVIEIPDEKYARQQSLLAWVKHALSATRPGYQDAVDLIPLSGDAGFRRYFRVVSSRPAMLAVDAPPQTEKNQAFCHIAQLLRQYGIHAPQVYAVDYNKGFLLLEDLGGDTYWPLLQEEQQVQLKRGAGQLPGLYQDAADCLLKMQKIPVVDAGLPAYDTNLLQQEMDLFPEWFVKQLLGQKATADIEQILANMMHQLINSAIEQPQVVVHRDYHCRNLMRVTNNNPGVIDFQDAVIGPITYDLVSLYRDCYIFWPPSQVRQWTLEYRKKLLGNNIIAKVSEQDFLRWFDWMGLQRHIKVLGIFARLYLRDHKPGYLKDLPLVIHYTLLVAKQYSEFSDFVMWFERDLLPKAQQCDWYVTSNMEMQT